MEVGIKGKAEFVVTEALAAKQVGSGALNVLATPMLVAGMEEAAWTSVQPYLDDGCGSVGTKMDMTHDAATPVGMKVTCISELVAVDGRKLTFRLEAFDEKGPIGKGVHERFIIENEKFQKRTDAKLG